MMMAILILSDFLTALSIVTMTSSYAFIQICMFIAFTIWCFSAFAAAFCLVPQRFWTVTVRKFLRGIF